MSALARIDELGDAKLDAIVLEKYLLGDEAEGLLRAVLKLYPGAGIVVLCEDPEQEGEALRRDVIFEKTHAGAARIARLMIEAKGMAVRRRESE